MAEACDALLLTGLPYFYAGATASGRGTVQVSVRQGIDYLGAIARSLLRQGFKRQIYISFHGPAHMTICPMLRDFYDETGVPILYMDMCMQLFNKSVDLFMMDKIQTDPVGVMKRMDSVFVAGYRIMGRLDDVPCTTEFSIRGSRAALPLTTCSVLPIKAVQSDIVSKKWGSCLHQCHSGRENSSGNGRYGPGNYRGSGAANECTPCCRTDEGSGTV